MESDTKQTTAGDDAGDVPDGKGAAGKDKDKETDRPGRSDSAAPGQAASLPPEVRSKLRKLEKLEATYPGTWPHIATNPPLVF